MSHDLDPPIWARFIRFLPVNYYELRSMRFEVYGCRPGKHVYLLQFLVDSLVHGFLSFELRMHEVRFKSTKEVKEGATGLSGNARLHLSVPVLRNKAFTNQSKVCEVVSTQEKRNEIFVIGKASLLTLSENLSHGFKRKLTILPKS